jgi:hypothetical protein
MDLKNAISKVRNSVVAIMRYRMTRPQIVKKGKTKPAEFEVSWGSGFCIVSDRYILTAYHLINGGKPGHSRNPNDTFLAFAVPSNGDPAYHFPVIGFPLEKPELDLAILEIGPCVATGIRLPGIPISFDPEQDGSRVITVGFPNPEIAALNIDSKGVYIGGQFFLKSHANEGILSAQYGLGPVLVYEFNVGWHHGESGGPVVRLDDPIAAFTIMQQYRNIQTPFGTVAGPHRGCSLSAIQADIQRLGAQIV